VVLREEWLGVVARGVHNPEPGFASVHVPILEGAEKLSFAALPLASVDSFPKQLPNDRRATSGPSGGNYSVNLV
jgi:hypothetical protein